MSERRKLVALADVFAFCWERGNAVKQVRRLRMNPTPWLDGVLPSFEQRLNSQYSSVVRERMECVDYKSFRQQVALEQT